MSRPRVLFICTHNAARSQMAEGWLRELAGDRCDVASAGVEPGRLSPFAVDVMQEVGVDIRDHRAEPVDAYLAQGDITHVISVCDHAADACPSGWAGDHVRLRWSFSDPSGATGDDEAKRAVFRRVRDEIGEAIRGWLAEGPV